MGCHRCAFALLVALPATFIACKATARLEFHLLGWLLQDNLSQYRWLNLPQDCLGPLAMERLHSGERECRQYFRSLCNMFRLDCIVWGTVFGGC